MICALQKVSRLSFTTKHHEYKYRMANAHDISSEGEKQVAPT